MRRLPFWATIFTLIGVIILCGLGTWQVKRLAYKKELIAQIKAELAMDPMMTELTPGLLIQADMNDRRFIRGFVEGVFLHEKEILVGPRIKNGIAGYHVITPFEGVMSDDVILVDRGWIPRELAHDEISHPTQSMIITGTAAKPPRPNDFTPDNNPDKDEWYWLDIHAISKAKKLSHGIMPYILYADPEQSGKWPEASAAPFNMEYHHQQYAMTWFSMAIILLAVYYFRFVRQPGKKK